VAPQSGIRAERVEASSPSSDHRTGCNATAASSLPDINVGRRRLVARRLPWGLAGLPLRIGRPRSRRGARSSSRPSSPRLNLWSQPQPRLTRPQINHRPGHVGVPLQVAAHGVAMTEAEDLRDGCGIDQVLGVDTWRHGRSLQLLTLLVIPGSLVTAVDTRVLPRRAGTPGAWPEPTGRSRHGHRRAGGTSRRRSTSTLRACRLWRPARFHPRRFADAPARSIASTTSPII
jgi:hypothetical protein